MSETQNSSRVAPTLVISVFVAFLFVIGYVMVSAFLKPSSSLWFDLSPVAPTEASDSIVRHQLTIDGRHERAWVFVDLARRSVVLPPDTAGWDLAIRRFDIIPSGAAIDLGPIDFDSLKQAPESGYVASFFRNDTTNAAIDRWYNYSFTSHILEPNGHVYVVQTADGRFAKLSLLSYYCPEVTAGCVTIRYVYQPSGSFDFES